MWLVAVRGRIRRVIWTRLFYAVVSVAAAAPILFAFHYWHLANTKGWLWTSEDSRGMYVDAAKTLITAAGIAVALVASSGVRSSTASIRVVFSAKVAAVCLISCVCVSILLILALSRGHEMAKARYIEERRRAGYHGEITEGKLSRGELLFILVPTAIALSCFLIGFLFLGRMVLNF